MKERQEGHKEGRGEIDSLARLRNHTVRWDTTVSA